MDCLMARTTCLVCFIILLMAATKKKSVKTGTNSRYKTNLKQSILETLDLYGEKLTVVWAKFSTLS
jgi:hypothetical protein